jgi:hypothetical protein
VSVTDANANPKTDRARFISSFKERHLLIQALLASSYLPGFSGRSAVTIPTGLGIGAAYDGVCSNPLPVPPGECVELPSEVCFDQPGACVLVRTRCTWDAWYEQQHT